jgi:hypothetical protein
MTPEQFTEQLPRFASDELGVAPPLVFRHVSARVFPLRANLDILQQFCNNYLNIIPDEAGYFRAPLPYVLLAVLDYSQIGEQITNAGWFSQVEVYFGVPVEWYKCVNGQWVFQDWGVITPYIFVNDYVSVPVGRTVYGYPKILSTVELTPSQWIKDPLAPTSLARISTEVFPEVFRGGKLKSRVFLEVETATLSNLRLPFDATSPTLPWTIASNLADAFGGFGRDAWWMAQGMRICPVIPSAGGPELFPAMLMRLMHGFTPGGNGFVLNALNLKQFRREDDPANICYRALTNDPIEVTALNRSGLLGENRILLGDLSGGYSISLYEHASLPIAQTLGLEVYSTWTSGGVQVDEFRPVMPVWIDVDLNCERGINLAWQTRDGAWKDEAGKVFCKQPDLNLAFNTTAATALEAISGPFRYTGTTIRVIPLLAEKKTLQKYLDRIYNQPLQDPIVDEFGREVEDRVRFVVWATDSPIGENSKEANPKEFAYVYLAVSSFTCVFSKADNVGDWAKRELSFFIPVKLQRKCIQQVEWETVGVGLVPAVTLVDNSITAFTRLEIQGIDAKTAQFIAPENVWLGEEDAGYPKQTLLQVRIETLPAVGEGQNAKMEPIVEISQNDVDHGLGNVPQVKTRWAGDLKSELERKKTVKRDYRGELRVARALSIELLGSGQSFSIYTLKQFRDANDSSKACYQSLVRLPRTLSEVSDVREIENTLTVRIFAYPSTDIVTELGLDATPLDNCAAGVVYSMQGLRPFYIRGTLEEPTAECLLSRSGTSQWTMYRALFDTMLLEQKNASQIVVDLGAEAIQDLADPTHPAQARVRSPLQPHVMQQALKKTVRDLTKPAHPAAQVRVKSLLHPQVGQLVGGKTFNLATLRTGASAPVKLALLDAAIKAVDSLDPQVVIESILSREWSNSDPKARWRAGREALIRDFRLLPVDGDLRSYAEAELYREKNNTLATSAYRVGAVAGAISPGVMWKNVPINSRAKDADPDWVDDVKKIISSQRVFTTLGDELERYIDRLSPLFILGLAGLNKAFSSPLADSGCDPEGKWSVKPQAMNMQPEDVFKLIDVALCVICKITKLEIEGDLDDQAQARQDRLEQLLDGLLQERAQEKAECSSDPAARLVLERKHEPEMAELVQLSRQKHQFQLDIFLNKLAKAYQKPDFCILRDAFPVADRQPLLPIEQSWDDHWYYGPPTTARMRGCRTGSGQEGESQHQEQSAPPSAEREERQQ